MSTEYKLWADVSRDYVIVSRDFGSIQKVSPSPERHGKKLRKLRKLKEDSGVARKYWKGVGNLWEAGMNLTMSSGLSESFNVLFKEE